MCSGVPTGAFAGRFQDNLHFSIELNESVMSYFKHHVFFCNNQRDAGIICCGARGADELRNYAKDRIKALGLHEGDADKRIRINSAGCLDRCDHGPVAVVYPEGVWYTYLDKEDIDEIIDSHLVGGKVVERLKI
ncbi:MAG: hypothetical protein RL695_126 [Pseudomonadota bacterium]|jgi:(2Fe-2S) ferredoxin